MKRVLLISLLLFLAAIVGAAQAQDAGSWTYNAVNDYRVVPNVTYSTANNYACKLDVYACRNSSGPTPTVLYIHGGGWGAGLDVGKACPGRRQSVLKFRP